MTQLQHSNAGGANAPRGVSWARRARVTLVGVAAVASLAACRSGGTEDEPAAAITDGDVAIPTIEPAGTNPAVGMISSGTATIGPSVEPPSVPEDRFIRTRMTAQDAASKVSFGVLEPVDVPMGTRRSPVFLLEPLPEDPQPDLPAVLFLYSVDNASLIIRMSEATGLPAEGEPVTIGGHEGWRIPGDQLHLLWEQDGVRIDLRATTPEDIAMAAAASMQPFGSWDEAAFIIPMETETPTPEVPLPATGPTTDA
jgi:hypothetical protein